MRDLSPNILPHADGVNPATRRWFAAPTRAFRLTWGALAHLLENARALSDFDEVAVRIAQVTANVHLMILGRAQELAAAVDYPAFYSYAYPAPKRFGSMSVKPKEAFFHKALGEFVLPYDVVRKAEAPDAVLLDFLQSAYEAAANAGHWERTSLECPLGKPRTVPATSRET